MTGTKSNGGRRIRDWDRWLVAEAPRKRVGPRLEPGRWSFFPVAILLSSVSRNHHRAITIVCTCTAQCVSTLHCI